MTAEGTFPKVAGDIFYASEANKFNPKIVGIHERYDIINTSGTVHIIVGSVFYSGTVPLCNYMRAETMFQKDNTNTILQGRFRISGTAGLNFSTANKTTPSNANTSCIYLNHIFTSGEITASGGNIGSNYWIYVEALEPINSNTTIVSDFIVTGW